MVNELSVLPFQIDYLLSVVVIVVVVVPPPLILDRIFVIHIRWTCELNCMCIGNKHNT